MAIKSEVTGVDVTVKALKKASASLKRALPIVNMSMNLRRAIQKKLLDEGYGRVYYTKPKWRTKNRLYQASRRGAPPASPTGNLKRAVTIHYANLEKTEATVGVHGSRGIGALAVILEKRLRRLFVEVTFQEERPRLEKLAERGAQRALAKAQVQFDADQRMAR